MAFVPASSIPSGSVTVVGTVSADVTDRAGRAVGIVTGPQTDAEFAARLPFAVTGPLTDAQLRATAVPVGDGGGSLTVDGPLTDTQLRATPVPVDASGVAVPVTGPLTDTQLRASRVPVDGSGVTQPVSAASLPLPVGAATEETLDDASKALNDVALTAILQRDKLGVE